MDSNELEEQYWGIRRYKEVILYLLYWNKHGVYSYITTVAKTCVISIVFFPEFLCYDPINNPYAMLLFCATISFLRLWISTSLWLLLQGCATRRALEAVNISCEGLCHNMRKTTQDVTKITWTKCYYCPRENHNTSVHRYTCILNCIAVH